MDCSLPDSSVLWICQARILEWVAIPFSRDLPDPGIKYGSSALQADSLPTELQGKPYKRNMFYLKPMEIIIKTKNHGVVRRKLNCIKEFVLNRDNSKDTS